MKDKEFEEGIISGAVLQLKEKFCLSCFDQELVVSSMLFGALLGSCFGGMIIDWFGRRFTIIVNAGIFTIGAVIAAGAPVFYVVKRRGLLVSLNELGITCGLLIAYLVNYACIDIENGWRYMFVISVIPAVIQGIGMIFYHPFTGQPNVLYYASTILQAVGFHTDSAATLATVGLGDGFGVSGTFFFFSSVCIVSVIFIFTTIPETKGKSLEQISEEMNKRSIISGMKARCFRCLRCFTVYKTDLHQRQDNEIIEIGILSEGDNCSTRISNKILKGLFATDNSWESGTWLLSNNLLFPPTKDSNLVSPESRQWISSTIGDSGIDLFYVCISAGCGHCRKAINEIKKLGEKLEFSAVDIAIVDITNPYLPDTMAVSWTPFIRYKSHGASSTWIDYTGSDYKLGFIMKFLHKSMTSTE
ncbi:GLUT12 [Mytilus edulis]|uniref:SLC2A12 n=1 Tax=Mytilus edulis TaxID=6550 RepID=A0A8S3VF64_MYTED|nr:GLUT12 [Mytilus edulis]